MDEEKKIYIGNLDYSVTEEDLKKTIEEKGFHTIELKIVADKFTGRSKGFGFAEFEKNEDAQTAIESLNGHELKGRKLKGRENR